MRDQTDSRTLPLSLSRPARKSIGQTGAAFLPLSPAAEQEREFQRERIARSLNGRMVRRFLSGRDA